MMYLRTLCLFLIVFAFATAYEANDADLARFTSYCNDFCKVRNGRYRREKLSIEECVEQCYEEVERLWKTEKN
ncbi:unnamed protein product [Cylicocyclus nassatus]|uniref:Uncharacterized protein n=1 Tax=Cylicocyclus nassatus TaxID=53992 RepID=A0AA36GXG5_CYLNA|nr:unnamed protein product [Cylicocyclus nassatus]